MTSGQIWQRRRELEYDNFDQFKDDNHRVNFIQEVFPNQNWRLEQITIICDCVEGIRGKICLHAVAQYFRLDLMKKPSEIPEGERFSKSNHGRVPGSRKQIRF